MTGQHRRRTWGIAQILMNYMHVKTSMSPHGDAPGGAKPAVAHSQPDGAQARAPDLDAVRAQVAKARAVVQRVHDAAGDPGGSAGAVDAGSPSPRKQLDPTHEEPGSRSDRTSATDALVDGAGAQLRKADAAGLLLKEIERNAGGLRRPALATIEPTEMERLKQEFADLGGDPALLHFNRGDQTGYLDSQNIIVVRGGVGCGEDEGSYLQAQFQRLRARRGPKKAIIAVAASMLTAAYHILRDAVPYKDLGSEHFTRRNKEHAAKRLKKRLEDLGFSVEVRPASAGVSI